MLGLPCLWGGAEAESPEIKEPRRVASFMIRPEPEPGKGEESNWGESEGLCLNHLMNLESDSSWSSPESTGRKLARLWPASPRKLSVRLEPSARLADGPLGSEAEEGGKADEEEEEGGGGAVFSGAL